MTNILAEKKHRININKMYLAIGLVSFIVGMFLTNRADSFVSDHTFFYQSPIVIQSPVVISKKPLISPVAVVVASATPSAVPTVEPTIVPKVYRLY